MAVERNWWLPIVGKTEAFADRRGFSAATRASCVVLPVIARGVAALKRVFGVSVFHTSGTADRRRRCGSLARRQIVRPNVGMYFKNWCCR